METEPLSYSPQATRCDEEIPGLSLGRSVQRQNKDMAEQAPGYEPGCVTGNRLQLL